jgi:isoleucyl-tRNA synthetase
VPKLNLKNTEETHKDKETLLMANKTGMITEDFEAYYFNIVEEINDFNDWCISEDSQWGLPIPYF